MNLTRFWNSRPPAFKLAAGYVAIIMVVSLIFSGILYRLASGQLEEGLRHQYFRLRPSGFGTAIQPLPQPTQYEEELDAERRKLFLELLYFNLAILALGSALSNQLAKQTLRPIEDALEAQSRFTADASHELRTPLTAMQSEIEVALRHKKLTVAEAKELLESNLEEVAKLRALSDGLLRLARGHGEPRHFASVAIDGVVDLAVERVGSIAKNKRVIIKTDIKPFKVSADGDSLTDLIVILLDNAIKYSAEGKVVDIKTVKRGKEAIITVKDEGVGIADEDLPRIFDRFYRADSSRSKTKTGGYGLGLAIAKQIAATHEGDIKVKSQPEKGTTFTVILPIEGGIA
jgi:two-component system sensor histidine kinase CiaH